MKNNRHRFVYNGSVLLEAAYIFPMFLVVILLLVKLLFFMHDRALLYFSAGEALQQSEISGEALDTFSALTDGQLLILKLKSAEIREENGERILSYKADLEDPLSGRVLLGFMLPNLTEENSYTVTKRNRNTWFLELKRVFIHQFQELEKEKDHGI